jgi:hypothetical protein
MFAKTKLNCTLKAESRQGESSIVVQTSYELCSSRDIPHPALLFRVRTEFREVITGNYLE